MFRGTATGLRRVRLDAGGRAQRVLELGQRLLQVAQVREASPQPEVRDPQVRVLERAAARALAAAAHLLQHAGVKVLPGRYLARDTAGGNPGANRVRLALVAELGQCVEAAERIVHAVKSGG